MPKLLVDEGGKRRTVDVVESMTIGRGTDNTIIIRDRKSSRTHCRVFPEGNAFYVEDLHSSNGTYLNAKRIERALLSPGDVIAVGSAHFTFVLHEVAAPEREPVGDEVPSLEFLEGDRAGDRIAISTLPFTMGRNAQHHLVVADARVSGLHARILRENEEWIIEDCDSGNGLSVDGQRVRRHRLGGGMEIGMGGTRLRIHGLPVLAAEESARAAATHRSAGESSDAGTLAPSDGAFAEQDFSRLVVPSVVDQNRPLQVVLTFLLIGFFAAILLFGYKIADNIAQIRRGERDPNNLLTLNPSFEEGAADGTENSIPGWTVSESARGRAVVESLLERRRTKHGRRMLKLTVPETPPVGFARVTTTKSFDIPPRQGLRVSGQILNESFPLAGLEVIWLLRRDDGLREVGSSYTALLRPGAMVRNLEAVVFPPADSVAELCRVAVFAAGSGSLLADAIALELEDERTRPERVEQRVGAHDAAGRELRLSYEENGSFSVHLGRTLVAPNVRFAVHRPGEMPLGQLIALSAEPPRLDELGSARGSFALLSGAGSELVMEQRSRRVGWAQQISFQRTRGQLAAGTAVCIAVELTATAAAAPVSASLDGESVATSVPLVEIGGVHADEWALGEGAGQLIFTLGSPAILDVLPPELGRGGSPTVCLTFPEDFPGGIIDILLSSVSSHEQRRIDAVRRAVTAAQEDQRHGEVYRRVRELADEFPWRSDLRGWWENTRREVEALAEERLREIDSIRADLERYGSQLVQDFLALRIDGFEARFSGLPQTAVARAMREALQSDQEQQAEDRLADEARTIFEEGMAYSQKSRDEFARFYFEWVVRDFPDSPLSAEAVRQLRILAARH